MSLNYRDLTVLWSERLHNVSTGKKQTCPKQVNLKGNECGNHWCVAESKGNLQFIFKLNIKNFHVPTELDIESPRSQLVGTASGWQWLRMQLCLVAQFSSKFIAWRSGLPESCISWALILQPRCRSPAAHNREHAAQRSLGTCFGTPSYAAVRTFVNNLRYVTTADLFKGRGNRSTKPAATPAFAKISLI